jgi:LysM repeat protein
MAVMLIGTPAPMDLSRPLAASRAHDRRRLLALQAVPVSRRRARGGRRVSMWQWTLHAVVVGLAGWALGASWGVAPREDDPPLALEVRVLNAALPTDFDLDPLPPLAPPAEDERPLVERIAQYRVAPGDTLLELAQRFGINTETLLWTNPLPDPDRIVPGQGLTVLPVPGVLHTVADGETVALLADRYKVSPMTLIEANGLAEPYALRRGDELLVPNGKPLTSALPGAVPWPAPGTGVQHKQQFIEAAAAPAREMQRRSGAPASVAIAGDSRDGVGGQSAGAGGPQLLRDQGPQQRGAGGRRLV